MTDNDKLNERVRALATTSEPSHALDILPEGMMTPAAIAERMKLQTEQRNAFLGWIRKSMKEGIHYMPSPRKGGLPYLKQEGAMFVKDFYGVEPSYVILQEVERLDYYKITIQCEMLTPSGKIYRGLGWANSDESNFQDRISRGGLGDMIETIGQMARKRSLVNAARHLPFVAELFTEERVAEGKAAGMSEDSEEGLSAKHRARLRKIFAQEKQLGVSNKEKIKERIASLVKVSPDFSLKAFVQDDKLYFEYQDIIDLQMSEKT